MSTYKRMGEFLLAKGLIDETQLERAIEARSRGNIRFGEVLVLLGYVDEVQVTQCLAEQYQLPVADLSSLIPTAEALGLVSSSMAMSRLFLPIAVNDDAFYAVISDPIDLELTDRIVMETGRRLSLALASPSELYLAIARHYGLETELKITLPERKEAAPTKRRKNDDQTDRRELLAALAAFSEPVYPAA